jgi:hypothetical protein
VYIHALVFLYLDPAQSQSRRNSVSFVSSVPSSVGVNRESIFLSLLILSLFLEKRKNKEIRGFNSNKKSSYKVFGTKDWILSISLKFLWNDVHSNFWGKITVRFNLMFFPMCLVFLCFFSAHHPSTCFMTSLCYKFQYDFKWYRHSNPVFSCVLKEPELSSCTRVDKRLNSNIIIRGQINYHMMGIFWNMTKFILVERGDTNQTDVAKAQQNNLSF